MAQAHSFGPSCVLHEDFNEFTRRASGMSDEAPKLKAHFFYSSALPIDDPLSPLPTSSTSYQLGTSKVHPPRPFSAYDNAALEEAWQGLQGHDCQDHHRAKAHGHAPGSKDTGTEPTVPTPVRQEVDNEAHTVEEAQESGSLGILAGKKSPKKTAFADPASDSPGHVTCSPSPSTTLHVGSTRTEGQSDSHMLLCDDPHHEAIDESRPLTADELAVTEDEGQPCEPSKKHRNMFRRRSSPKKERDQASPKRERSSSRHRFKEVSKTYGSSPSERQTTGTPFLRALSPNRRGMSDQTDGVDAASEDEGQKLVTPKPAMRRFHSDNSDSHRSESDNPFRSRLQNAKRTLQLGRKEQKAHVPVGLSRLHLVEMPTLEVMIRYAYMGTID